MGKDLTEDREIRWWILLLKYGRICYNQDCHRRNWEGLLSNCAKMAPVAANENGDCDIM